MGCTPQKTTEQLLNDITTQSSIHAFFSENENEFADKSLSAYLNEMLRKHTVKKSELFRRAGLEGSNYGYELFSNDKKTPSRDILLRLCLAFPLSIDETQHALRNAGLAILYPRDMRDAYILFAIKNNYDIDRLNALLDEKGLQSMN